MSRIPTDKGAHLWLGGDFNLPDITWEEESVVPYATNSAVSNQLLTIVKDMYLDQVVTEPTRITETSSSTLDLFFTSNQTLVNKVEVIPGFSNHEAVFIESSLRPMRVKTPQGKSFNTGKGITMPWKQNWDLVKLNFRNQQKPKMLSTSGWRSRTKFIRSWSHIYHQRYCVATEYRSPGSPDRWRL